MRTTQKTAAFVLLTTALALVACKPDAKSQAQIDACMKACLADHNCDLSFKDNPHPLAGQCLIEQNKCAASCSPKSSETAYGDDMQNRVPVTLPPPVEGSTTYLGKKGPYGAIAYSATTHSWGASAAVADKAGAEKSAMGFCAERGLGCSVVDSFSNACVAVATGAKDVITWAHAKTPTAARVKAQSSCIAKTGDSCAIQFWECYPEELKDTPAASAPAQKQ